MELFFMIMVIFLLAGIYGKLKEICDNMKEE